MCAATAGVMNMWPGRAVTFVDSTSRGRATAHPHRRTHRRRTQDAACAHAHGHAHETRSGRARSRDACSASLATLTGGELCLPMPQRCSLGRRSVASAKQANGQPNATSRLGICAALSAAPRKAVGPHVRCDLADHDTYRTDDGFGTADVRMQGCASTRTCFAPFVCGMLCCAGTRWCRPALPKSCNAARPSIHRVSGHAPLRAHSLVHRQRKQPNRSARPARPCRAGMHSS